MALYAETVPYKIFFLPSTPLDIQLDKDMGHPVSRPVLYLVFCQFPFD